MFASPCEPILQPHTPPGTPAKKAGNDMPRGPGMAPLNWKNRGLEQPSTGQCGPGSSSQSIHRQLEEIRKTSVQCCRLVYVTYFKSREKYRNDANVIRRKKSQM